MTTQTRPRARRPQPTPPRMQLEAAQPLRDERLAKILGTLARRASTWGWLDVFARIQRGETVPRWHRKMVELTAALRAHDFKRPEGTENE